MATKKAAHKSKASGRRTGRSGGAARKPKAAPEAKATPPRTLPFEIDPRKVEESLQKFTEQVVVWAKKGRYTKVRFKFRGKQLLPDIPLAAVAAVEGLTFYWTGLLRALVFNLAGRTVLDVELVNDSEQHLTKGKEALLAGDLDEALAQFRKARDMDVDNPTVHLNLGIALKLKGDHLSARAALDRAKALDKDGPAGGEAERLLGTLKIPSAPPPPQPPPAGPA